MKKLKELYEPKAELAKEFVKAHPVKKTTDKSPATADKNTSFEVKTKTYDRTAHRYGYKPGEDEKAYDGGHAIGVNDQRKEVGIAPYTVREQAIEALSSLKEDATDDDVIETLFDILDDLVSDEGEEHGS